MENKATPWINKVKEEVGNLLEKVGQGILDAIQAQVQADILSMQMSYNAGMNAWNWFSSNWKTVVDWGLNIVGGASGVATILGAFGIFTIPVVGQVFLGGIAIGSFVWTTGRLSSWW